MGSTGVESCLHLNTARGASGYLICLQCGADVDQAAEPAATDMLAALSNTFGGRSASFERGLAESRLQVIHAMKAAALARGANGLAGASFDQQLVGSQSGSASMLLVTGTATAVVLEPVAPAEPT